MLIPKSDNDTQKKESYRIISLKKETKILNKILSSQVQQHLEKTIDHYLLKAIPIMERWFNTGKSTITIHYINRMK